MFRFQTAICSAALGVFAFGHSAMADVTPKEVWKDWQDYMLGMGYTLTGTENQSGDTLAISNVIFDLAGGPDQGGMTLSLGTLSFVQNGDGTVSVVLPDVMPINVDIAESGPESEPVQISLTITQTGQEMNVSGTPAEMTSTYMADALGMKLDQPTVGDESYGADNAAMTLQMTDVRNTTTSTVGAMRAYAQNGTVASVTYDMRFKNPDEPAVAVISGTSSDFGYTGDSMLPLGLTQASDMAALLREGMDVSANLTSGNSTLTVDIQDPNSGNTAAAFATEAGTLKVETSADGISYAGTREGLTGPVQLLELPFLRPSAWTTPPSISARLSWNSNEAQNFALGLNLDGFTASDLIWGMIDPQATLPRDPASVTLHVTGKARLLVDYFDPAMVEKMTNDGKSRAKLKASR